MGRGLLLEKIQGMKNNAWHAIAPTRKIRCMGIRALNLSLDEQLIQQVKLQAVRERRSVSEIVAQLLQQYFGAASGPRIAVRRSLEHPIKERRKATK
jgi:hypothetical protein